MSSDTSILVGSRGDIAWVRIEGVATKDTACGIQTFFTETFSNGLRKFTIDLQECKLIDSTFIGILTGLAGKVSKDGNVGEVRVIHPNERNEKSICKLGLDNLIKIDRNGESSGEIELLIADSLAPLEKGGLDKTGKATVIIDAHEEICTANEKNRSIFGDVIKYLKRDFLKQSKEVKTVCESNSEEGTND